MAARGLRLTVFYDADNYAKDDQKTRLQAEGTFEHKYVNLGLHYFESKDQATATATEVKGKGYSVWATPIFKQKGNGPELLLRYDSWEPDKSDSSVKQNTIIAGFAYWFPHQGSVTSALLLDYDQTKFPGTSTATQKKIGLHGLINF